MSARAAPCSAKECKRISRALCYCCQQNLCRDHLKEHDDLLNSQFYPIADEVNALADELKQINMRKLIDGASAELDKWRQEEYRKIDQLYTKKCDDMEKYLQKQFEDQKNKINNLQSTVAEHIREQDASNEIIDELKKSVQETKQSVVTLEQQKYDIIMKNYDQQEVRNTGYGNLSSATKPVGARSIASVDNQMSTMIIQPEPLPYFDISLLSKPYQTIKTAASSIFAFNGEHIVVDSDGHLCLYDKQLNLVNERAPRDWPFEVKSICYCSPLKSFIFVTTSGVLSFNDKTMETKKLTGLPTKLSFCTSSEKLFYFLYKEDEASILEHNISSLKCLKRWKYPSSGSSSRISTIQYHNNRLALIVAKDTNKQSTLCFELRDASTYNELWMLNMDNQSYSTYCCCPFRTNEWLVTNVHNAKISQVSVDGQIQGSIRFRFEYITCISQIDSSLLAISDNNGLHLFRIGTA